MNDPTSGLCPLRVASVFVSLAGFQDEVVNRFPWGGRTNVILWSGLDLALIFETWSLPVCASADAPASAVPFHAVSGAAWWYAAA